MNDSIIRFMWSENNKKQLMKSLRERVFDVFELKRFDFWVF
jgi:hypothetical protein